MKGSTVRARQARPMGRGECARRRLAHLSQLPGGRSLDPQREIGPQVFIEP
jgi:hypothetical protein